MHQGDQTAKNHPGDKSPSGAQYPLSTTPGRHGQSLIPGNRTLHTSLDILFRVQHVESNTLGASKHGLWTAAGRQEMEAVVILRQDLTAKLSNKRGVGY